MDYRCFGSSNYIQPVYSIDDSDIIAHCISNRFLHDEKSGSEADWKEPGTYGSTDELR